MDSLRLAQEIAKRATVAGRTQPCLLEINIDAEDSKSGFLPESLNPKLIESLIQLPHVRIEGLMAIPAPNSPHGQNGVPAFRRLAELAQDLAPPGRPFNVLSMGMSGDFEAAIAAGATHVRVGTALFGARS